MKDEEYGNSMVLGRWCFASRIRTSRGLSFRSRSSVMNRLARVVRRGYLDWRLKRLQHYLDQTADCARVQRERLWEKLRLNADSDFGRKHGFADIRTLQEYRQRVPIAGYEVFRPYVERVKQGETQALFGSGTKVLMFSMTSGTTAQSKYVPITNHFFREYRRSWNYWGLATFRDHPDLLSQYTLTLASAWDQFRTSADLPCGSISGLVAETRPWVSKSLFLLPTSLLKVKGTENKLYAALRIAIASPRVGMIATANPLTLVNLARMADEEKERLIRDVRNGTLSSHIEIPSELRGMLQSSWRGPQPQRAAELERIVAAHGTLYPRDFWPQMSVVSVWMGGSVAAYLPKVREYFGAVPLRDHGLSASEGHLTSPMDDESCSGLLDYDSHYYEFVPVEEAEAADPPVLEAHELEVGREYFIILTTLSGLYRYDIHDIVRCDAYVGACPMLTFMHKGAHFSSLTGEKLSELQVMQAVREGLREVGLSLDHFTLLPVPGDPAFYRLLVEQSVSAEFAVQIEGAVDRALCQANCEYDDRRQSNRMGPVVVTRIPQRIWSEHRRRSTAHEGADTYAYKHPFLAAKEEVAEYFRRVIVAASDAED